MKNKTETKRGTLILWNNPLKPGIGNAELQNPMTKSAPVVTPKGRRPQHQGR